MNSDLSQIENEYNNMYVESQCDDYKEYFKRDDFTLEDKVQFSNLNMNEPLDMKSPSETIQEFIFTEEKLEVQGKGLVSTLLNQNKFVNIKLLDLSKCKLSEIPDDVKQMNNLQKLYLSSNILVKLPDFLQSLKFLEILDLSYNQLQDYQICLEHLNQLNLACNYIKQPYFGKLDVLSIQMNPIIQLPKQFSKALKYMNQLEFDWFKYCKPPLPSKMNFKKYQWVQEKLINALQKQSLGFQEFIQLLSQNEQNYCSTDYKDRNLFCQAGMNDEIGVLYCLNQIIPQNINKTDFDNNTPLSVCYLEGKMRSVSILKSFGGKFSLDTIHCMSQRADVINLKFLLGIKETHYQLRKSNIQHPINDESLVMMRNVDGNTPLHQLMMHFDKHELSTEFGQILLFFGADPNAENYERYTPLDMAIKKSQLKGLKFANDFNLSKNADFLNNRFFDFSHQSTITGYGLCHTAVNIGNIEILEFLISINTDFFSINKSNKLPRNLATQNLMALKNIRKLEKRYILTNVIKEKSLLEQQEKNVYQMRIQIEKNMAQRHHNMIQKYVDQEEIEDIQSMESYNDFSLLVGSERTVRETVAESTPIFKNQQLNLQKEQNSSIQQNIVQISFLEFPDYYPDILKLLRSGNIDTAINKLDNILQQDLISVSERLKYKNQLSLLKLKFKQKNVQLKSTIGQGVQLILNEYQFKSIKTEFRSKYFKHVQTILNAQTELEISKALNIVSRQKNICSSFNLNRDLLVSDLSLIADLRARLSTNLVYDINNYASPLLSSQNQLYLWLYGCFSKKQKILVSTSFFNLQNFEYLQLMKFKKKRILIEKKDDLSLQKDMEEQNFIPVNQIICNNNLFCNSKRQ